MLTMSLAQGLEVMVPRRNQRSDADVISEGGNGGMITNLIDHQFK
jgi:hypothetical protein